jgi:hypothetical protein
LQRRIIDALAALTDPQTGGAVGRVRTAMSSRARRGSRAVNEYVTVDNRGELVLVATRYQIIERALWRRPLRTRLVNR